MPRPPDHYVQRALTPQSSPALTSHQLLPPRPTHLALPSSTRRVVRHLPASSARCWPLSLPLRMAQTSGSLSCLRPSPGKSPLCPGCSISCVRMTLASPLLLSPKRPFGTSPPGGPAGVSNSASGKLNQSAVCQLQTNASISYFSGWPLSTRQPKPEHRTSSSSLLHPRVPHPIGHQVLQMVAQHNVTVVSFPPSLL